MSCRLQHTSNNAVATSVSHCSQQMECKHTHMTHCMCAHVLVRVSCHSGDMCHTFTEHGVRILNTTHSVRTVGSHI